MYAWAKRVTGSPAEAAAEGRVLDQVRHGAFPGGRRVLNEQTVNPVDDRAVEGRNAGAGDGQPGPGIVPKLRGLFGGVELRILERGEADIPAAAAEQLEALFPQLITRVDCHVKRSALSSGT